MAGGSNLFQGTLELLVLRILLDGPLHGYDIGRRIRERSDGGLAVEEGALYPALHRLDKKDFVSAQWGVTERGRRARFYTLTSSGRGHLMAEKRRWDDHVSAVGAVLREESG